MCYVMDTLKEDQKITDKCDSILTWYYKYNCGLIVE